VLQELQRDQNFKQELPKQQKMQRLLDCQVEGSLSVVLEEFLAELDQLELQLEQSLAQQLERKVHKETELELLQVEQEHQDNHWKEVLEEHPRTRMVSGELAEIPLPTEEILQDSTRQEAHQPIKTVSEELELQDLVQKKDLV